MAHDVFLSYSSEDKTIADTLVASFESKKIRCWYAPRDIKPGADWGSEIVKAISVSKIFVLIFSKNANQSQHVLDELNLAMSKEKMILPFRVEKLEPSGAMELHLSARHWLDAFSPSWEKHIENLVGTVQSYLGIEPAKIETESQAPKPIQPETKRTGTTKPKQTKAAPEKTKTAKELKQKTDKTDKKSWGWIAGGIAAVGLVIGGFFLFSRQEPEPEIPTPNPTQEPTEEAFTPVVIPGDIPEPVRSLADSDASMRAEEHRVLSGDNFPKNLFERPFTADEMIYQPHLDIQVVDFAYDETFFYFTLKMKESEDDFTAMEGVYGIEFDFALDGRGEIMIVVQEPPKDWSFSSVKAYQDLNGDVGGQEPIEAEEDYEGDGYESLVVFSQEAIAFARISPENPAAIDIAVSGELIGLPVEFLWGAFADGGLKDISAFDYNDGLSIEEAGSPFIDNADYPIAALYSYDNTCRLPFGFAQESATMIPGICINVAPVTPDKPGEKITCPPGSYLIDGVCTYIN